MRFQELNRLDQRRQKPSSRLPYRAHCHMGSSYSCSRTKIPIQTLLCTTITLSFSNPDRNSMAYYHDFLAHKRDPECHGHTALHFSQKHMRAHSCVVRTDTLASYEKAHSPLGIRVPIHQPQMGTQGLQYVNRCPASMPTFMSVLGASQNTT